MFYIFDCDNRIVGNPKGYKTHRGAQTQCNLDKSKLTKTMALLWDRFHEKAQLTGEKSRIYSIRWVDPVAAEIVKRTGVPADRLIVSHVGGR